MTAIASISSDQTGLRTVAATIADQLRLMIVRGEKPPGTWLRQRPLARELGVSPMPVVEALRRLETTGLVEAVPKWGVRVRAMTVHEWEQLALMRAALEGQIARRLAERSGALTHELTALHEEAEALDAKIALPPRDPARRDVVERDLHVHRRLAELSGLHLLAEQLDRQALIERVLLVARYETDRTGQRLGGGVSHAALIHAIATGDGDQAEHTARAAVGPHPAMLEHLRQTYGQQPITAHTTQIALNPERKP